MLKLSDFGQKSQEIAGTIVQGINAHGLEVTILSMCDEKIKKKKLNELKRLIREKKGLSFLLKEPRTNRAKYRVVIECADGNVEVFPISCDIELEFNKFSEEVVKEVKESEEESK